MNLLFALKLRGIPNSNLMWHDVFGNHTETNRLFLLLYKFYSVIHGKLSASDAESIDSPKLSLRNKSKDPAALLTEGFLFADDEETARTGKEVPEEILRLDETAEPAKASLPAKRMSVEGVLPWVDASVPCRSPLPHRQLLWSPVRSNQPLARSATSSNNPLAMQPGPLPAAQRVAPANPAGAGRPLV
ncbi:hypothetical protein PAPYR_10683 [Paratrimastix pyriformis]|uniref:Uncharacterized protein n=1 Tax=Paratrimastix pyriformis TaxID=342808 RepID=A0ABQ8U972_9EUKA|nr:hypothetical protein PAPYR_10683 [Paratrimastix pyriformis]